MDQWMKLAIIVIDWFLKISTHHSKNNGFTCTYRNIQYTVLKKLHLLMTMGNSKYAFVRAILRCITKGIFWLLQVWKAKYFGFCHSISCFDKKRILNQKPNYLAFATQSAKLNGISVLKCICWPYISQKPNRKVLALENANVTGSRWLAFVKAT